MKNNSDVPVQTGESLHIGLPVASLILGIISIAFSLFLVGGILALIGAVLGVVHLKRRKIFKKLAIWGISLSVVGLLASICLGYLYYQGYKRFRAAYDGMKKEGPSAEVWQGVIAPDFTMQGLDGKEIRLKDLRGKRVVLDFWATWCPPCVKEIPHFIKLASDTSRDDLVIIGISSENKEVIEKFVKKKGINYPIASSDDLPSPYGDVRSIPTTFFIDRNGVIQNVFVGYHDYETIRTAALAEDYQGEPKEQPPIVKSNLQETGVANQLALQWDLDMAGCRSICAGDWDGDGVDDILVIDRDKQMHVISLKGRIKASISLPTTFSQIEIGHHATQGARLLGYSNWGKQVTVLDTQGNMIWEYPTTPGVDGAHWGDLDRDGTDELIVGMNGGGGLHAVSANGEVRWKVKDIGNVWNQAIVSPEEPNDCLVLATEAGGTIRVYDREGHQLHVLRPLDKYYAQMTASVVDNVGTVQVIALGEGNIVGFNPQGEVSWSTAGIKDPGAWRGTTFACGDMDGDNLKDWIFRENTGDLVIASPTGVKLASLPIKDTLKAFAVASGPGGKGYLVTMYQDTIQAYALVPGAEQNIGDKTAGADEKTGSDTK
ncbi:MAG: redoxin domain-containing protein [PVC group bacterium]